MVSKTTLRKHIEKLTGGRFRLYRRHDKRTGNSTYNYGTGPTNTEAQNAAISKEWDRLWKSGEIDQFKGCQCPKGLHCLCGRRTGE